MESIRTARVPKACDRPFAFLITTAPAAQAARDHLGSPAYSYGFVVDALKPVLERLGTWQVIDRPETRLAFAARRSIEQGARPIHLAIVPTQDVYHTSEVPTVLFPFWEFPRIPDRDFGFETRQNWARMCRPASLIISACSFTAAAFRAADVQCPVAVVPVPLDPANDLVPSWSPSHSWTFSCRHAVLGGRPDSTGGDASAETVGDDPAQTSMGLVKRIYHRLYPYIDPKVHQRIARFRIVASRVVRTSPPKLAYLAVRKAYKVGVRPWLSEHAVARVTALRERLMRRAGFAPSAPIDPLLPCEPLTLSGLVYTTLFNVGDLRKNFHDILSAFLLAFRDREDVTLVIKLATNPRREHFEAGVLHAHFHGLGIRHRCRVVVITEYLDDDAMRELMRATTYYVNASYAEGACLPLQQALAAGRPVIAPDHTAMADYMDDSVGWVIRSHPEPTHWPHDPERRIETERMRPVWADLFEHYHASAHVADHDPTAYARMSTLARQRMAEVASRDVAEASLRHALGLLPEFESSSADDWLANRGQSRLAAC